jgi:hypothetical protein
MLDEGHRFHPDRIRKSDAQTRTAHEHVWPNPSAPSGRKTGQRVKCGYFNLFFSLNVLYIPFRALTPDFRVYCACFWMYVSHLGCHIIIMRCRHNHLLFRFGGGYSYF